MIGTNDAQIKTVTLISYTFFRFPSRKEDVPLCVLKRFHYNSEDNNI